MDSIFGKFILITASILGILGGSNYIQVTESQLDFNFKTGNNYPIYYFLNVQNIGPQKARFDVSSDVDWLFVYREGQQHQTNFVSIELPQNIPINFVLEVHPERLGDGIHQAKVTVKAVDLNDYSILETKEIPLVLNKNIQITATPAVPPAETEIQTPLVSPATTPSPSPTPVLKVTPKPTSLISPKIKTPTPSPEISPVAPEKVSPVLKPLQQLIESLRSLVRFLFRL